MLIFLFVIRQVDNGTARMVLRQRFQNLTFVSEPTQTRTRAGTRNQGARAGEEEADDMEEDLTDDESVVIREAPPPPQPRRSSGNCNFKLVTQ
jgi:hypothetical protein